MAALGYDVLLVLMDAAQRARDAGTPGDLAGAISATKGLKGVTGTIDLTTPDRTPVKDAVILKVEEKRKFHQAIPAPR
jgi:ABC-type branched-subunit amino acid transport system substrate-binding protein